MTRVKELIRGVFAIDPSANALEECGSWRSWGEIAGRVDALEDLCESLGLGIGARVAIFMANRFEPFAAFIAIFATERCLVTINPFYPDAVIAADIVNLAPPVVVATQDQWARPAIVEAVRAIGAAGIVLADAGPRFVPGLEAVKGGGLRMFAPGVAIEMLTSGTTGVPKRVSLTASSFQHSFDSALAYEKGRQGDPVPKLRSGINILHSPLSHISGLWSAISAVAAGRKVILLERFNIPQWRAAVLEHRPKVTGAPPSALRMILDADIPPQDLSSLVAIFTGTAPLDASIVTSFSERYGIAILNAYGATEFAGGVAGWSLHDFRSNYSRKSGSVGRLQRGVEARIVRPETGEPLPFGEVGLLELRARQLAEAGTWLRTSDLATLDEENFLWIVGRADSTILRGGFKVHPDNIVRVLEQHPAVREAAVVGIPDERLGHAPAAAVILKKDAKKPTGAELASFVKERMLPYEVPVKFEVMADFPRTLSMKPALGELRSILASSEPDQPATRAS